MQGGVYHIFENHFNYKFLRDGATDPFKGLEFTIIRLNSGDVAPEDAPPLATVTGCGETYNVLNRLTGEDAISTYKKADGTGYSPEL